MAKNGQQVYEKKVPGSRAVKIIIITIIIIIIINCKSRTGCEEIVIISLTMKPATMASNSYARINKK